MAHTLLPGHVPLNDETMDRFSIGPDNNLYLDDKKVVTQDLFQSFKNAGRVVKTVTFLVAVATFLSSATTSVDTLLKLNDRYCWQARFYSSKAKCSAQKTNAEDGHKARENPSVSSAPAPEPTGPKAPASK
jgi:hypothetical protein